MNRGLRRPLRAAVITALLVGASVFAVSASRPANAVTHASARLAWTPVVGGVTATSAVVVAHTSKPASVVVHYGVGVMDLATPPLTTKSTHNNAAHVTLAGLLPDTTYAYTVEVDGVTDSRVFTFTTFPPAGESRTFTFLAYSDQDTNADAPSWLAGAREHPAFVVQLGDFTHTSGASKKQRTSSDWWKINRLAGATTDAGEEFRAAIGTAFPFVHIWDDHDYGAGNGDRTFKYRSLAMAAFADDYPTYPVDPKRGFWQSFRYGQAEVFVLDLRSARDPDGKNQGPTKSMLGSAQKAWLLNGLASSTATWKFIVSSSVWNPHSKKVDSWAQYANEQNEIVDFVRANGITGVIVMSGDIHSSGAIDDGTNSYFPEISVPHTNLDEVQCTGPNGCGDWSEGYTAGLTDGGYALFRVGPDSVTIEAKGTDGAVRHSLTVTR